MPLIRARKTTTTFTVFKFPLGCEPLQKIDRQNLLKFLQNIDHLGVGLYPFLQFSIHAKTTTSRFMSIELFFLEKVANNASLLTPNKKGELRGQARDKYYSASHSGTINYT